MFLEMYSQSNMNEPVYWVRGSEDINFFLTQVTNYSKKNSDERFIIYEDDSVIGTLKNGIFYPSNSKK